MLNLITPDLVPRHRELHIEISRAVLLSKKEPKSLTALHENSH